MKVVVEGMEMEITEKDLQLIIQSNPGDIIIYKLNEYGATPLYYAPTMPAYTGYTDAEYKKMLTTNAMERVLPQDRDLVWRKAQEAMAGARDMDYTYRILHKNGKVVWAHVRARGLGTMQGAQLLLTEFFNISAETDAFASMVDRINGMVYVIDADTRELYYFNKQGQDKIGKTLQAGDTCYSFLQGLDHVCPWCPLTQKKLALGEGFQIHEFENPLTHKYSDLEYRSLHWFDRQAVSVFRYDVTDNIMARKQLKDDNLAMEQTINNIPCGIAIFKKINGEVTCIDANPYVHTLLGLPPGTQTGRTFKEILSNVHPEDRERCVRETVDGLDEHGSCDVTYRIYNQKKDRYIWLHLAGKLVPTEQGEPLTYFCYSDATASKMQEQQYQQTLHQQLLTNPNALCAFKMNLTRNTCEEGVGSAPFIQKFVSAASADETIDNIASLIMDQEEKSRFQEVINRKHLLEAYTKGTHHVQLTYRRRNEQGNLIWVKTFVNTLQNPHNDDVEALAYSVDANQEMEESQIIRAITGKEYDYIALVDVWTQKMRFFDISRTGQSTRPEQRETYDETMYQTFANYPAWDKERSIKYLTFKNVLAQLQANEEYTYTFDLQDKQGRNYHKQVAFRYLDKDRKQILVTRTDMTAAFRQEKAQTQRIKDALLIAEQANESKSSFLSSVSHDMRTPLNAILGYARLAGETQDVRQKDDYVAKIGLAGHTLLDLINDTLDLQKIETGVSTLKLAPAPCADVVKGILTAVKPMIAAKHINFVFDNSKAIMANINVDMLRVQEIMINLLSNAVKYTPEGGRVEFVVECVGQDHGIIHDKLVVRDNGIGISKEFLPKIFDPFTQERTAATAHIGGSGLGLTIVKRLVDMMHGHIEVRSELGKGSEFIVYLDLERLPDQLTDKDQSEERHTFDLKGLRILMCEDNAMNTEIAKALLQKQGVEVICAANGQEGLEKFNASAPGEFDAILMDIRMPVLDGYQATAAIRSSRHVRALNIPIIAISADAYEEDVKRSLQAGMNMHLGKPFNPDQLYETLAKFCHRLDN